MHECLPGPDLWIVGALSFVTGAFLATCATTAAIWLATQWMQAVKVIRVKEDKEN